MPKVRPLFYRDEMTLSREVELPCNSGEIPREDAPGVTKTSHFHRRGSGPGGGGAVLHSHPTELKTDGEQRLKIPGNKFTGVEEWMELTD